jgi:hypothetical protein
VRMSEIRCRKVILITALDNYLLKTVFRLKLLHLALKSADLRLF